MEYVLEHLLSAALSVGGLFCFVPFLIKNALARNVVDSPDGVLKKQEKAVPYLGGVGIYLSFIIPIALLYPCENNILWFLLGATLLLFVGLIDDLLCLSPLQKIAGQLFAVICFLRGGFALKSVFFSSYVNTLLSAFWMLSVINAFNLIDIMDGLASLTALVASFIFFLIALYFKVYSVSLLLVAFMGSLAGFLYFNKPPAKIYMGDAGSLFIGGFLAAIPMLLPWSAQSFDAYYAPAVVLAIPILEISSLIIIRSSLGIPFYQGSPHHFALYLKRRGWSVSGILCFVVFFGLTFGALATLFLLGMISFVQLACTMSLCILMWIACIFGGALPFLRLP